MTFVFVTLLYTADISAEFTPIYRHLSIRDDCIRMDEWCFGGCS